MSVVIGIFVSVLWPVQDGIPTLTEKCIRRVPFGCYKIGRIAAGEDAKFITNDVTQ